VGVQALEDRPVRRRQDVLRQDVIHHAHRGGRQQVAAVGLRLA
jgi:hypothetical protein